MRCDVCGQPATKIFDLPHGKVVECGDSSCRLRFLSPQPDDTTLHGLYNNIYYRAADAPPTDFVKENSDANKLSQHIQHLNRLIGIRGKRILDFGCGSGKLMQVAEASGAAEVVGIENNPRARQEARDLGFRVVSNIGDLGQEQFDILYLNDVIEHLRDPVETCAALRTHLSPGGALFVATINCASLKARLLGPRWDMYIDPTHFYYFRRSSLIQVLREAGYEEIQPLNFTVVFSHHGPLRRQLQHLLVALGLDSSIKIIAVSPVDVSLKER